jgi:hypothetical protein
MAFDDATVQAVWDKGSRIAGNDPALWRQDSCGAWIGRRNYGNRNSQYGWEIDHIRSDGGDGLSNLQPLQWENNIAKSDGRQVCVVVSRGNQNVPK